METKLRDEILEMKDRLYHAKRKLKVAQDADKACHHAVGADFQPKHPVRNAKARSNIMHGLMAAQVSEAGLSLAQVCADAGLDVPAENAIATATAACQAAETAGIRALEQSSILLSHIRWDENVAPVDSLEDSVE